MLVPRLFVFGLVLALGCLASTAEARVTAESRYTKAQNYSAALRFLRVDMGYEVVERDAEAAYLIFRYPTPQRKEQSATGTIEVVEVTDGVTLIVRLSEMPEYHERLLSKQLMKKLRDEYGPPVSRKPAKKPAKERESKPEAEHPPRGKSSKSE